MGPLRLRLENIRGFAALDLELGPRTLLLGENGTGKSTVLRAIAEALGELSMLDHSYVRNGADTGVIHLAWPGAGGAMVERRMHLSRIARTGITTSPDHAFTVPFHAAYGAGRRAPRESFASLPGRSTDPLDAVRTLFNPDAALVPLRAWVTDLHYRRGDEALERVRGLLNGVLRDAEFRRVDRGRAALIFSTPDGEVPFEALSDGLQNVATWLGDLLYRITEQFPDVTDLRSVEGILLVDEIDLHLHPLWQRQLLDTIQAALPGFQLIATTHSPLTAQQAGPGEVVVLERSEPGAPVQARRIEADPRLLTLDEIVTSPIFGVPSTRSSYAERARSAYRGAKTTGLVDPSLEAAVRRQSRSPAQALLDEVRDSLKGR